MSGGGGVGSAAIPHREENPDPDSEAVVVIARSTREAIVVNLPGLHPRLDNPPT
ncbi:hypothetical protein OG948_42855 (plasmid) [Embleya sp. NBC_00888]|uniref:hypothetical protein n=1 Tax=Embleya sp. NBC_00888 TaxID=2975960 RepID=UPI002F912E61|nr:hypothetical protein OG948_42855 [Embleya sp. NBC_00888]